MSYRFFKNLKHARRKLPEVYLSIQAVDKKIKPSYLWDAFSADILEINLYLEDLYVHNLIDHKLDAICIGDAVLVTLCDNLKNHLESCTVSNIDLIDISENIETPVLLSLEEKTMVFNPVMTYSQDIISHLHLQNNMIHDSIDYTVCNLSTLFGLLLGYPVLYWFSQQSPHSDFSCLSMIPLKVYKVFTSVCLPGTSSSHVLNSRETTLHHELFSFSIPDAVSKQTEHVVQNWFNVLLDKNQSNSMFNNLKMKTDVISLPSVCM